MKVQEEYVLNHLNLRISQSPIGFSVDQNNQSMELVNEWFPTGKFINFDKPFIIEYTHEKKIMAALPLIGNDFHKSEMEYNVKFGHNIGRIKHIDIMSRIGICYSTCNLATQNVAPTLPGFQVIKLCVQYMDSHPHKPILYTSRIMERLI